jgi:hypothetical protein
MEHVLTDAHGNQLAEYLRFLRRKRDTAIAEVAAEFKEVRQSRLFEETYSVDDVESMLDGLLAGTRHPARAHPAVARMAPSPAHACWRPMPQSCAIPCAVTSRRTCSARCSY